MTDEIRNVLAGFDSEDGQEPSEPSSRSAHPPSTAADAPGARQGSATADQPARETPDFTSTALDASTQVDVPSLT
jgi:hypothetical protein